MKNITVLLLIFMVSALFFSCNDKDEKEPVVEYFISATVNGSAVYFNEQAALWGQALHYEQQHELNIYGSIEEIIGITIQVLDNQAIAPGVYAGLEDNGTHFEGVRIIFSQELNNYITDDQNPVGTVEITELSETEIRGNFSGELKILNKSQPLVISNGQFFVKREG